MDIKFVVTVPLLVGLITFMIGYGRYTGYIWCDRLANTLTLVWYAMGMAIIAVGLVELRYGHNMAFVLEVVAIIALSIPHTKLRSIFINILIKF